jgi:hypothetical protein
MMGTECFLSFLGFYRSFTSILNMSVRTYAELINEYAVGYMGMEQAPSIPSGLAQQLGLKNVRDISLKVGNRDQRSDDGFPPTRSDRRYSQNDISSLGHPSRDRFSSSRSNDRMSRGRSEDRFHQNYDNRGQSDHRGERRSFERRGRQSY